MKKYLPYGLIFGIVLVFFYKTFFFGKLPFPGDLLLASYAPWRHTSYSGYVAGAVPSKDQYFDVVRELYPWKTEVIRQLKDRSVPLWNPYSFSGSPLLANYQSQVFYPLGILYAVLPQWLAWTTLVILQPALGMWFMYLFATVIGLSPVAALIAAVAFNFSAFSNVWMEFTTVGHTILWLPLLLYFVEKGIRQRKLLLTQQLAFVFALFSSITGGHPQDFINGFLFFLIYTLTRVMLLNDRTLKEKILLIIYPFSTHTAISFLIAGPQLLPTIELFSQSARVPHNYRQILESMLFAPIHLVLVPVQEFFGNPATKTNFLSNTYVGKAISIGSVGFFLSLFSLDRIRKNWHATFFFVSAVFILLYTVNTPLAALLYRYPIPLLSTGSPTRVLFLFCLSLSILAGFGFDRLRKEKSVPAKPFLLMGIIMGLLWFIALIHPQTIGITYTEGSYRIMQKAMLMATALTGVSAVAIFVSRRIPLALSGILLLACAELFYGFTKFNPFVPKPFVFPDNPLITYFQSVSGLDRIWGYGTAQIEANFTTQYRLFSTDGTDPLNLKWYNAFIQSSRDGNIAQTFTRTTRSDAQIAPGYGIRDLPDNPFRLRVMDALGVKYIVDRTENPKDGSTFPTDRFKPVWHKEDWTVYENLKSAPRFFLAQSVDTYGSDREFESKFFSPQFDPASTVLVEATDARTIPAVAPSEQSRVELISYAPNALAFKTTAQGPQLLYVSDTFDFGWNAYVDGNPTRVYKANYAFRAVPIPQGTHTVLFRYEPVSFKRGIALLVLGLSGLVVLSLYSLFRSNAVASPKKKKR